MSATFNTDNSVDSQKRSFRVWNMSGSDVPPYGVLWVRHAHWITKGNGALKWPPWDTDPPPADVAEFETYSGLDPITHKPFTNRTLLRTEDGQQAWPVTGPWITKFDGINDAIKQEIRDTWPEVRNRFSLSPGMWAVNGAATLKRRSMGTASYLEFPARIRYEGGDRAWRAVRIGELVGPLSGKFGVYPDYAGCWVVVGKPKPDQHDEYRTLWISPSLGERRPVQAVLRSRESTVIACEDYVPFDAIDSTVDPESVEVPIPNPLAAERVALVDILPGEDGHGLQVHREGVYLVGCNVKVQFGGESYDALTFNPVKLSLSVLKADGGFYDGLDGQGFVYSNGTYLIASTGMHCGNLAGPGFMPYTDGFDSDGNGSQDSERVLLPEQTETFSIMVPMGLRAGSIVTAKFSGVLSPNPAENIRVLERTLWVSQQFPLRFMYGSGDGSGYNQAIPQWP